MQEAGTSEAKETAMVAALFLLGKYTSTSTDNHLEPLRLLLDNLPYGLGRHAWRLVIAANGRLLF